MNLKDLKTWIVLVVLLGLGIAIGRFALPSKTVVKTETKTVTKEVVVTKEVDKTDYYKNKVLIETTTTKPDGTVIREREFVDKSVIIKNDEKNTTDDKNSTTTSSTETSKTYSTEKVNVKALVARNMDNLSQDIYGAEVDKKILGPISVGVFGLTDKTLGLSLGLSF